MAELLVLLDGAPCGMVTQDVRGQLSFSYTGEWQEADSSYPLSLSMPLVQLAYPDAVIRAFMEGLLPDDTNVIRDWGRRFGVSANNPFSLLGRVGEDVAGAVQFVRPERLDELLKTGGSVQWLNEGEVAERLRQLVSDRSAWRLAGDNGYFSLAGAQPKTALLREGNRWGVPSGRMATTHILKPPVLELDALAMNEHLCLRVAGGLGLAAANSEVLDFGGQQAIVVERYDRLQTPEGVARIHQEDFCQAASIPPGMKYEAEGGPDVVRMVELIRENSSSPEEDILSFVASLGVHWILDAPDAHAKNYSLLIASGGQVRLAPLYDVISVLPYPRRYHPSKTRLAMRIGGEYRSHNIRIRHWDGLADSVGLDPEQVRAILGQLAEATPDVVQAAAAAVRGAHLDPEFGDSFADVVAKNAQRCARVLAARTV